MFKQTRMPLTMAALMLAMALSSCGQKTEAPASSTSDATTAAQVKVTKVDLGRAVGADYKVTDATNDFKPNDTVYAAIHTSGAAPSATLAVRWTFQDGQVVDESQRTIAPQGDEVTEFHISKPDGLPAGKYKVEILVDGAPVESKEFEVKA